MHEIGNRMHKIRSLGELTTLPQTS